MSNTRSEYLCDVGKRGQSRLSIFNTANLNHIDTLINKLDLGDGMQVLDLACGSGEITCRIGMMFPQVNIIGIDFSEEQLASAKALADKNKLTNITFITMSVYDIKTLASTYQFDRIFVRWLLGHLKEPQQVIASCKALLKPNGIMICEEGDVKTHHCKSTNHSFQACYGLFVSSVIKLQKLRGVDAEIGSKLPEMLRHAFDNKATLETISHQLMLKTVNEKEAASTLFIDEIGHLFIENNLLNKQQLDDLKEQLAAMTQHQETTIAYTTDTAVILKL